MADASRRSAVLLVTEDDALADCLVPKLTALDQVAVAIDNCDTAVEMMEAADFALVLLDLTDATDWRTCRTLIASSRAPVAVVTRLLAQDGRYRRRAFDMGVAAYLSRPCAPDRLAEMLDRVGRGERGIEIVGDAAFSEA